MIMPFIIYWEELGQVLQKNVELIILSRMEKLLQGSLFYWQLLAGIAKFNNKMTCGTKQ
jgi:hypothetical protein